MKGGLAAATEAIRAIQQAGVRLKGDLLVSTHGLHELPTGHGEDLIARVRRGIHGDAAIVTECGSDVLPVAGVGQAMFEITIRRAGEVTHENSTAPGTPHPIYIGARLATLIEARNKELAATTSIPYAGPESFFVGEFHSGDFFNRFPVECRLIGTRRYAPGRPFEEIRAEVEALCQGLAAETGTQIELVLTKARDGFLVDEHDPLVTAVRGAYQAVTGRELPLGGLRSVADASIFNQVGGIPALYHGPGGRGHHADEEAMPISELVRAARVLALTALDYCGRAEL
jgi:acetylornithine deacetylase/succinyl-diaminopimelate desuccinylase-like protein